MAKVEKVRINSAGARDLLSSSEIQKDLLSRAEAIRNATGMVSGAVGEPGYTARVFVGRNRARGIVQTYMYEGIRDNAKNQTLLKNLDKGR
ncbi:hypothetical protein ACTXJU_03545 [Glutamicibacter ardleyensis]|uniref:hypothetical protein n=1 Tax=Glutamicibacter ardleyensis TaxID=225894 RepID=UPI003FD03621